MGRYRLVLLLIGDGIEEYPQKEVDLPFCPVVGHVFATDCWGLSGSVDEVQTWLDSPPYETDVHLKASREITKEESERLFEDLKAHGWVGFDD